MAATKRTPTEIARDRRLIAHLYLAERLSQAEIADQLNTRADVAYTLSRPMISYDLRALQDEWLKASLMDLTEAKARELARIDRLEREYWTAWYNVSPAERTAPQYLAGVLNCIKRRCDLLGLDEPELINVGEAFDLDDWRKQRSERRSELEGLEEPDDAAGDG